MPDFALCRLCCKRRARMTDEDVVSRWLRRWLLGNHFGPDWSPAFECVKFRICRACNAELNEMVEKPALPVVVRMLEGEQFALSLSERLAVARWLVKTDLEYSMMRLYDGEYWLRDELDPREHPAERRIATDRRRLFQLMRFGRFPVRTTVTMGYCKVTTRGHTARPFEPASAYEQRELGLSAIQIFGPLWSETVQNITWPEWHAYRRSQDDRAVVLYPAGFGGVVRWPPAPTDLRDAAGLRMAWSHKPEARRDPIREDRVPAGGWLLPHTRLRQLPSSFP